MQGFSLRQLKHLVLDEADRLLHMDFEQEIDQILKVIPKVGPLPIARSSLVLGLGDAGCCQLEVS